MGNKDTMTDVVVTINGVKYQMNKLNKQNFGRCDDCPLQNFCLYHEAFANLCLNMDVYCNFKEVGKEH